MKSKPQRLTWGGDTDNYTCGVLAGKLNMVRDAKQAMPRLAKPQSRRLFTRGVAEARRFGFHDLAFELARLRRAKPRLFDVRVRRAVGLNVFLLIREIIIDFERMEARDAGST